MHDLEQLRKALVGSTVVGLDQDEECASSLTLRLADGSSVNFYPDSQDYEEEEGEVLKAIWERPDGMAPPRREFLLFRSEAVEAESP